MGSISVRHLKKGKTSYYAEAWGGGKRKTKTHKTRRLAQRWIDDIEDKMATGQEGVNPHVLLRDAIDRYIKEAPHFHKPKSRDSLAYEFHRLNKFKRMSVADIPIAELTKDDGNDLIRELLQPNKHGKVNAEATVGREMTVLKGVLRKCNDWYGLTFPWTKLLELASSDSRRRNITDKEIQRVIVASAYDDQYTPMQTQQRVGAMFLFAIETAMRQGEIAKLTPRMLAEDWVHANLPAQNTKSKRFRAVPITPRGREILRSLPTCGLDEPMFRCSAQTCSQVFKKIVKKAGLPTPENGGFTFHDTRHLACMRLVKMGFAPMELIEILGHTTVGQAMTYYHPDVSDHVAKMEKYDQEQAAKAAEPAPLDAQKAVADAMAVLEDQYGEAAKAMLALLKNAQPQATADV